MSSFLAVAAFCFLFSSRPTEASVIPSLSLPELVQHADAICIGTPTTVSKNGQKVFDTGTFAQDGTPLKLKATKSVAAFSVDGFIKGKLAGKTVTISFPTANSAGTPFQLPLTQLIPNQRVIVFLEGSPEKGEFNLFLPTNLLPTAIPVGPTDATVGDDTSKDKPLRPILNAFQLGLSQGSKEAQLMELRRISECGFILYKPVNFKPVTSYSDAVANLRRSLNEPDGELESFVENSVIPSVYNLTQSPDGDVSLAAILTSASLQLPSVIPALQQLAHNNVKARSDAISALQGYANPKALGAITALLKDDDPQVRDAAAYSLRLIDSPKSLPFLIDSLKFGDQNTYNVFAALNEISHARMLPNVASFETQKSEITKLWTQWAADNQSQLEALRAGTITTFVLSRPTN